MQTLRILPNNAKIIIKEEREKQFRECEQHIWISDAILVGC